MKHLLRLLEKDYLVKYILEIDILMLIIDGVMIHAESLVIIE